MNIYFKFFQTNGIKLHTAISGQPDGEPVILLHGFPEAWFGWEAQIQNLAAAGYRVIAPDQRGYNLSDKPKGKAAYQVNKLAQDIIGLANTLGIEQFNVAGHDWGAMVCWYIAIRYPRRVKRLVIANVPHPTIMSKFLRRNPKQLLKSWYALFFQIPGIPERIARINNWRIFIAALPEDLSDDQQNRYRAAWSQPGAMTAMINWYRAAALMRPARIPLRKVQAPTLVLWGKKDPFLSYEMAQPSVELCESARLVTFEEASHWVLQDKPDETSRLIIEHFRGV